MTLLRRVARPMLSSIFIVGAAQALRSPGARVAKAQPIADALAKVAPQLPLGGAGLVRVNAAVQLVGGLGIATGTFPRLCAFAVAATMPPTTVAGHQFWNESDPAARSNQVIHFLKNVALTGGLLMSTLDPDPHKPWLGKRVKDGAEDAIEAVTDRVEKLKS